MTVTSTLLFLQVTEECMEVSRLQLNHSFAPTFQGITQAPFFHITLLPENDFCFFWGLNLEPSASKACCSIN